MDQAPDAVSCVHEDWRDWWQYHIVNDEWLCPCGARQDLRTKVWTRPEYARDKRPLCHSKNRTNRG